jgi:hypothetical protein
MNIHDAQPQMSFTRVEKAGATDRPLLIARNPVVALIQLLVNINKQAATFWPGREDVAQSVALIPGIG